jgi:hypothetical protein
VGLVVPQHRLQVARQLRVVDRQERPLHLRQELLEEQAGRLSWPTCRRREDLAVLLVGHLHLAARQVPLVLLLPVLVKHLLRLEVHLLLGPVLHTKSQVRDIVRMLFIV